MLCAAAAAHHRGTCERGVRACCAYTSRPTFGKGLSWKLLLSAHHGRRRPKFAHFFGGNRRGYVVFTHIYYSEQADANFVVRWRRQHFSLVIDPWRERAAVVLHHLISIVQKHLLSKRHREIPRIAKTLWLTAVRPPPRKKTHLPLSITLHSTYTYNRYRQDTNRSPDLVSRQPKRNFLYSVYDGTLVHIDFSVKSTPVVPPPPPPSPPPMCLRDTHKYTHTHAHTHI